MSTNNVIEPLGRALFSETRRSVLAILYRDPNQSFYVRQIIRMIGSGHGSVQRELKQLSEAGILTRSHKGRDVYYQANLNCPIYEELRGLILKTSGLADILRAALSPLDNRIEAAFIYGSFTVGRDTTSSDVDLMVIGDVPFWEVVQALQPAQETLGREINPTVYPPNEFVEKVSDKHNFLNQVLSGKKIFLIGDNNELTQLAR